MPQSDPQTRSVPFFRPAISDEEIEAVSDCLRSGWLTTGHKTSEFEQKFSQFIGQGVSSIAVNSATAALHLGLEAMGVTIGDEVIVPTLTFTATAEVVRYLGAKPVFVDIDPSTNCLSIPDIVSLITPKTKVIIPVYFGGLMPDMSELRSIANHYDIFILADAAHALPASNEFHSVGDPATADATAFSFYANKTITTGEGGMLVSSDQHIINRAKIMRLHGIDRDAFSRFTSIQSGWRYDIVAPGFKYNLTDIASSIGLVQLTKALDLQSKRESIASTYLSGLANMPLTLPPVVNSQSIHSWHLFVIQLTDSSPISRDELISSLADNNIGTSVHYTPLHKMTYWSEYAHLHSFPNADSYFDNCLSLPIYPSMSPSDQEYVISTLSRLLTV